MEGLISSVTSYVDASHADETRSGKSHSLRSVKRSHREGHRPFVSCIHPRKTTGRYFLLVLN
jgi:hypothetical protein